MAKYLRRSAIKGQYGVNVVEKIVLKMGYKWIGGDASLDTGIDGEIELRDPETDEAKNLILRVQVKTRSELDGETAEGFRFTCKPDDLEYWMQGNAQVLLVIVKIPEDRVYWMSIKDYFADPEDRIARQIQFDKKRDEFTPESAPALLSLAQTPDDGVYFVPTSRTEQLVSNLLEVTRVPDELWMAESDFRTGAELWAALREEADQPPREWFLRDGRVYSTHNPRESPLRAICDVGTVESIAIEEWRDSDEWDIRRNFVRMLNACLRQRAFAINIRWFASESCYCFKATHDLSPGEVAYKSLTQETSRVVFRSYAKKSDAATIAYYRHCGFEGVFRRFGGRWYLQITPRYVFTTDGNEPHPYREEYQAKIKTIEGSAAVRGLVVMFASLLSESGTLFRPEYAYLGFGELAKATVAVGIDDSQWYAIDEVAPKTTHEEEPEPLLFEP